MLPNICNGSIKNWFNDIKINPQHLAGFQVFPYFLTLCYICQPLPLIALLIVTRFLAVFLTRQKMIIELLIFQFPTEQSQKSYEKKYATIAYNQKQPSRDVHRKRYSENMQQIYRTTPMPKRDFNKVPLYNKVALQLY